MTPVVSIITPCYNAAQYIGRTIASVRAQSFVDWEHVVVDDGSRDDSAKIVSELAATDPRLRLVTYPNGGCARARNRGVQHVSPGSRYLFFLDADDLLEPRMLETMTAYMDRHPNVGMSYCGFTIVGANDELLAADPTLGGWHPRYEATRFGVREIPASVPNTPFESIFVITSIIPSVAFFRREVFERTSGWDEEIGVIYEDVGLYLRTALQSEVHYLPEQLVRYRRHGTQSSTALAKFQENLNKLYAWWDHPIGLNAREQAIVAHARWFRDKRLAPFSGFRMGLKKLRAGELLSAGRFCGGAVRRYLASFLTKPAAAGPVELTDSLTT